MMLVGFTFETKYNNTTRFTFYKYYSGNSNNIVKRNLISLPLISVPSYPFTKHFSKTLYLLSMQLI